jgi:AcrR family transcriptional regulator
MDGDHTTRAIGRDERPTAQKLLRSAVQLFASNGFARTSVQELADASHILKGSVYHYISSKEDLLVEIIEETQVESLRLAEEAAARTDLAPLERLAQYVYGQIQYNGQNIERTRVYYSEFNSLPSVDRERLVKGRKRFESIVDDLIREAMADEHETETDSRLLMLCLFGITNWMHVWYRPEGRHSADAIADVFTKYALAGIIASLGIDEPIRAKLIDIMDRSIYRTNEGGRSSEDGA